MALLAPQVDDLVREYLLFRGFTQTLKTLDLEIKVEKEKGFNVDRIIEQMLQHVSGHDLSSLRELWLHLSNRIFSRLESPAQISAAAKLEAGLLKLYVVNCLQNKRTDKAREFFDRLSAELQGQSEWRDWFVLPFIQTPENNQTFSLYFSRQWQDTLVLSLHNFLSITFACLPPPRLADFSSTVRKIERMSRDNELLKHRLRTLDSALRRRGNISINDVTCPDAAPSDDLMDDFYIIAQQEAPSNENQAKTLKSFLRNITGGSASSSGAVAAAGSVDRSISSRPSSKQLASSLKQSKSRSSSKTRSSLTTTSTSPSAQQQQQQQSHHHAPVRRVSQATLSTASASLTPVSSDASAAGRASPGTTQRDVGRPAYLLLGQEEYVEHHSEVTHARFSSSGYVIASGDVDGVVKVWTASPAPHTRATFVTPTTMGAVTALEWLPETEKKFVYGTTSGSLRICDVDERRATNEVVVGGDSVSTVSCSPNAANFVVACGPSLCLYDLKTMSLVHDLSWSDCAAELTSCSFNHNCQMVFTSGADGKVRIFDLRRRDCISSWSVSGSSSPVLGIALSADETSVYAVTSDGTVSVWSVYQSGQCVFEHVLGDPYFSPSKEAPCNRRAAWGRPFSLASDGSHLLACSSAGGVVYEMGGVAGLTMSVGEGSPERACTMDKVLSLRGHRQHTTCTDWSTANDCGPCITADCEGLVRISTLLSH